MEQLIQHYGLIAVLIGAGIEGEPFTLAGGIMAQQKLVPVPMAVAASIAGAIAVDQLWFFLSRHYRDSRVVQSVVKRPAFARALELVERHPRWFVFLFRFAYGLRAVAPVAIGASKVPARLFVPLELAAAVIWGAAFTAAGYLAGPAFEAAEQRYGTAIAIVTVALSGLVLWLALRRGPSAGKRG